MEIILFSLGSFLFSSDVHDGAGHVSVLVIPLLCLLCLIIFCIISSNMAFEINVIQCHHMLVSNINFGGFMYCIPIRFFFYLLSFDFGEHYFLSLLLVIFIAFFMVKYSTASP